MCESSWSVVYAAICAYTCLQCLGIQHAEAAFVDDSCIHCGRCQHFIRGTGRRPDEEDSAGLPPSGAAAAAESDLELMAMLSRAAVSIGLEVNSPHGWTIGFSERDTAHNRMAAWRRGTHRVTITPLCPRLFNPWSDLAFLWAGVPLEQVSRHVVVTTDASSAGWGATCNRQAVSGSWTGPRLLWHINCLELLAVHIDLR
ncbi:hypothetical protein M9458_024243, partial [Cirrhinus mrigala]